MNTDGIPNSDEACVKRLRAKFIVFDGPDGSGKSTQRELFGDRLEAAGGDVVHCKDPGGTDFGNMIRSILLDHDLSKMDVRCETFLFMASRAQLVGEIVKPALAAGKIVLCDRFISSTCAYQVAAGYDMKRVLELGQYAVENVWPDLTLVLDVPIETGFQRTGRQPKHAGKNRSKHAGQGMLLDDVQTDAMEARPLDFHRKVRNTLLSLPETYPREVIVVNGVAETQTVHDRVWEAVAGATL
ncbi:MAG: dTMP kinase [Planctomycetes bacterium]|nr:dTMP kinase [Planctomycetota bacterium]